MPLVFGAILRSKVTWIVVGTLLVVGVAWGNYIRPWLAVRALDLTGASDEIAKTREETAAKQAEIDAAQKAIAELSKEYAKQKAIAEKAKADAVAAKARAQQWQDEASRLGNVVAKLEADRRALPAITSRTQAVQELRRLGY